MEPNQSIELFEAIKQNYESPNRHRFMQLTESQKVSVASNLLDKIYVTIAERYNHIDFGTIPNSKGNITNMPEYANLKASIQLLQDIERSSNQEIPEIRTLSQALANMERLSDKFQNGFMKKNAGVIMFYNLLAMSLYCGTSLMISVVVDYVNVGNSDSVQVVINKKYRKNQSYLMINTLSQFNSQVKNGSFVKNMESMMRVKPLTEGVMLSTLAVVGVILSVFKIIPLMRELIYLFYYSRMKLSEAAEIQANLINANVQTLEQTVGRTRPRVVRVQKWIADKLMKISQLFAIKYEKNEKQAANESKTKITQDDIELF